MALYDPQEFPAETKVGADFTLAEVLAWARTKPADGAYCYTSNGHCAVAQFLRDTGRASRPSVSSSDWFDMAGKASGSITDTLNKAVGAWYDETEDRTFGGLVRRLEALAQ